MNKARFRAANHGWSLVELMIALAIVGILGAIAVPSYLENIRESRRMEAKNELLQLKLRQESYRLDNNAYATSAQLGMPASDYYTFSVTGASATQFSLVATAKNEQVKDVNCKVLTIDQSSNKTPAACW
ncbi:prepilin-type N-terminal cleavage/methylation domain-containing protein [Alteromonas sp. ASW11-19]|uniref:Prepilin-type N-terminal cleavage/methylation domain-containing protein n=1 Tax=Alteromonas salexigens TaxID=2982530 RepID=A0ABT2VS44_9ALTE|nr:type IV pilin protein [Alteromonas salexigens]MCU7555722.1 prepilin-type N-terminal cleavage/methylation domain-containing protein [Alteromonas salexigens]